MGWVKISDNDKRKRWTISKIIATVILVAAVVSANTLYFRSYTKTEASGNKWAGIKEAFNNETFSTINVTLGLPLITIILNEIFEIDKAVAEKTEDIKQNNLRKQIENAQNWYNLKEDEAAIKNVPQNLIEKIDQRL